MREVLPLLLIQSSKLVLWAFKNHERKASGLRNLHVLAVVHVHHQTMKMGAESNNENDSAALLYRLRSWGKRLERCMFSTTSHLACQHSTINSLYLHWCLH